MVDRRFGHGEFSVLRGGAYASERYSMAKLASSKARIN
jgi:hypothetical protein